MLGHTADSVSEIPHGHNFPHPAPAEPNYVAEKAHCTRESTGSGGVSGVAVLDSGRNTLIFTTLWRTYHEVSTTTTTSGMHYPLPNPQPDAHKAARDTAAQAEKEKRKGEDD